MQVNKLVLAGVFLATASSAAASGQDEAETDGQKLYETHCGTCHQLDGGGVPMLQPELIDLPRANGPVGGVIDMILFGSDAIAETESDYGNVMPSFAALTDLEIALIATYVRTNFENDGGPVTADDVRARRDD